MNQRQILRQTIRSQRQQLTLAEQQRLSQKITLQLSQQAIFQKSQNIASYIAINGEIDSSALLQFAQQQKKACFLPVIQTDQTLKFVRYENGDALQPNQFKIPEPQISPEKIIAPQTLDLVLMPLLAFDMTGNRLGMGAGYYDRTFAFKKSQTATQPFLLGLAYEFQKGENLLQEAWDVPLDAVITEHHFYLFGENHELLVTKN